MFVCCFRGWRPGRISPSCPKACAGLLAPVFTQLHPKSLHHTSDMTLTSLLIKSFERPLNQLKDIAEPLDGLQFHPPPVSGCQPVMTSWLNWAEQQVLDQYGLSQSKTEEQTGLSCELFRLAGRTRQAFFHTEISRSHCAISPQLAETSRIQPQPRTAEGVWTEILLLSCVLCYSKEGLALFLSCWLILL